MAYTGGQGLRIWPLAGAGEGGDGVGGVGLAQQLVPEMYVLPAEVLQVAVEQAPDQALEHLAHIAGPAVARLASWSALLEWRETPRTRWLLAVAAAIGWALSGPTWSLSNLSNGES